MRAVGRGEGITAATAGRRAQDHAARVRQGGGGTARGSVGHDWADRFPAIIEAATRNCGLLIFRS
jgi:hypothetical protein